MYILPFNLNSLSLEFALLTDEGMVVNTSIGQGLKTKAFVRFNTASQKVIRAKVGISAVSTDGAKLNLTTEIPDWDFEKIKAGSCQCLEQRTGKDRDQRRHQRSAG
jgi:putative alpha-1,2-mannosidase